ncbi:bactofilin family protein [Arenicellales bacterium nBUS_48]|jgi:cytoskeletal protein CcmA (bactofilin family)|nr:polymer-forming cytoskeletal protein [Pseudomonadota bacterium]
MTQKEIETPAAAESPNKPAASQAAPAAKTPDPVKTNGRKPATIGPSIVIHGDVSGEEDLIVDGTVEGTVNFKDNNLVVSANGQVKANISARIIRIDGEVKGELHGSEQVVISPSGKVHGDIRAPRVVLEDGCTFRGSVEMETEKSPAVDRAATPRLRPTAARPVRPGRES